MKQLAFLLFPLTVFAQRYEYNAMEQTTIGYNGVIITSQQPIQAILELDEENGTVVYTCDNRTDTLLIERTHRPKQGGEIIYLVDGRTIFFNDKKAVLRAVYLQNDGRKRHVEQLLHNQ